METKLCTQSHILFNQGMKMITLANIQDMMCHAEHYMKFAIKFLRLHNETLLTLDKLRKGGRQEVIVQHVNVNDGGKAAIMTGNFQARGGGEEKK